jgi:hypothetical protein
MPNVLMNGVLLGKELTRYRFLKLDLGKGYMTISEPLVRAVHLPSSSNVPMER